MFGVRDNIRDENVAELEGLCRHFYHRDAQTNQLNGARRFLKFR